MAIGYNRCYVCDSDIDTKAFAQHMKDHTEDLKKFRFSNNTLDYCRSACKICGEAYPLTRMREHTKKRHNMVITEYKKKFNQSFYDIVEKVFHKCGICKTPLLFDSDVISSHLSGSKAAHNITHKEYNLKFMVIQQGGGASVRIKRKSEGEELNPKVAKHPDLITKVNTEQQKSISEEDARKTKISKKIGNNLPNDGAKQKEDAVNVKDEELETTLDELSDEFDEIGSIKSFRNLLALITDPGRDPTSYPAIEKILGMDTSSEEAMVEAASQFCSS